jgi:hypothetical protein
MRVSPGTEVTGAIMTTTHAKQVRVAGSDLQEDGLLELVVGDNVLSDLGEPTGPHRTQVERVWGDNYRVNVFLGTDAASFKIAHSFFLTADGNGKILGCSPPILRTY